MRATRKILSPMSVSLPTYVGLPVREHIEYADAHGVFRAVDTFLRNLKQDEWLNRGYI